MRFLVLLKVSGREMIVCIYSLKMDDWTWAFHYTLFFSYALRLKLKDFSINIFLLLNTITNTLFLYLQDTYHHGILFKKMLFSAEISDLCLQLNSS